ncbi:ABC transporter substrate-binding protein [Hoeflea prorocentri]|uniref:ABC transporter substrate-binding protein n=1 Tax=Hoeflea prorocentri TaxID=1922333 RepID=A0A9X3UJC0_9HYPH|nr:ABC transporter substrate-binding protein [Hoeflea prorocentri]MCY6381908.1 ABC transporter substrate-binding protein [Hoeflea prorocentri]MDA5399708.1 ABC transporter substrate-binding protein [Hoeflea prorocentri]
MDIRLGARDVGSLDPAKTKTGSDEYVALQIFNSLIAPPRGTMDIRLDQLQPQLAESWEISDDKKTWTFRLRPGVKWHKGYGEVSADDVKFSFERQLDPDQGGVHGGNLKDIESIEVIDPLTVRFNLKQGNAFFHAQALTPGFGRFIVPKAAVEALGNDFNTGPVGSGPFELVEYQPQEGITLKAHEDYFLGRPPMDEIRFHYIPDINAATIAFIGGELDLTSGQRTTEWVDQVTKAVPDAQLIAIQPGSLQFLHLNMKVPPLDDVRVRQALAHGIDRSAWGKVFGEVHGPLETIVPQSFYGAIPLEEVPRELRYDYSPERAKELLAQAGYPDGFEIDAIISERDDYLTNMLMAQDMLRKIGVTINLEVQDHATYHANIREDKGTIVELSTGIAPTAPAVINEFLHSAGAVGQPSSLRNFSHYGNIGGSVDELIEAAVVETDTEKQLKLLHDAQLQIQRDVPVLPMQTSPLIAVVQGDIDLGYEPKGGFGQHELATARRVGN